MVLMLFWCMVTMWKRLVSMKNPGSVFVATPSCCMHRKADRYHYSMMMVAMTARICLFQYCHCPEIACRYFLE
jgi:glycerol-3-phosphate acyltransferase PlsY